MGVAAVGQPRARTGRSAIFDDPQGHYRVLYASSQRIGPFLETLARFRRDVAIVAEYAEIRGDDRDASFPTLERGIVPADWREKRCIGTGSHSGRFVDVGHSDSLSHVRTALASRIVHYGMEDLDAGDLRRRAPRPSPRRSRATSSRPPTRTSARRGPESGTSHG